MRWVEPGRRRRRRLPLLPFAILILLLAAGGAVAYVLHDRAQQHAELRDTAVRFARAWEQRKPAAMYRELDADARSKYTTRRFAADYRAAEADATVRKVSVSRIGQEKGGQVRMAVAVQTVMSEPVQVVPAVGARARAVRAAARPAMMPAVSIRVWVPRSRCPSMRPIRRRSS